MSIIRMEVTASQFVGRGNTHHFLDAFHRAVVFLAQRRWAFTDHADDSLLLTFRQMSIVAIRLHAGDDIGYIFSRCFWFHYDNHGFSSPFKTILLSGYKSGRSAIAPFI